MINLINYYFFLVYFNLNSIRPMMYVIYLLIRATFSQKTYDALNLTTYSCFILLKERRGGGRGGEEEKNKLLSKDYSLFSLVLSN